MNAFVVKRETVKSNTLASSHVEKEKQKEKPVNVATKRKLVEPVASTMPEIEEKKQKIVVKKEVIIDNEDKESDFEIPVALQPHIDALSSWFESAMMDKRQGREIEGKIGSFSSDGFQSIVPAAVFNAQLARCQRSVSAGGIFDKSERETTVTYLFASGVRGTQYSDQNCEFVRKRRLSSFDIAFGNDRELTVRLSFNIETPCQPPCDKIQLVRLRQRESFFYKGTWRFDFTYVRQGATKPEATNAPLQHEIELEYIGSGEGNEGGELGSAATSRSRAKYNVISMLLKLHDLTLLEGGANNNDPRMLTVLQHIVKQD